MRSGRHRHRRRQLLERTHQRRVERTSAGDLHHGLARFGWQLLRADGSRLPEGLDIAQLSADGLRIESIVGFFGALKSL